MHGDGLRRQGVNQRRLHIFFLRDEMHFQQKKPDRIGQLVEWWLRGDSNPRHTGYEPVALTNWATQP